jgi:crotonobetainyl-CoA:carnitine CoA-transferase CaiB-like acyl-CoA transferase
LRSALNVSNSLVLEQDALQINRVATGNRGQTSAPSDLYRTSDGWILIQVIGMPLFKRIARLVEAEDWLSDPRFATEILRGENGAFVSERVGAWCRTRTTADALAELERARIPCGPVYSPQQVLDDPHVRDVGIYASVPFPGMERPAKVARTPVTLSGAQVDIRRAPLLGEHTDVILTELGYSEAEIEAFEVSGAI